MTIKQCEDSLKDIFEDIDDVATKNTAKVLSAFRKNNISSTHFYGSTGYANADKGREGLCKVFADIFDAEDAIVSPLFMSGTHTISVVLFGLLRPGDVFLSISGTLYDTLQNTIFAKNTGSLADFGIEYQQIDLKNNKLDTKAILLAVKKLKPKVVYLQKSRGYVVRDAISCKEMQPLFAEIKKQSPNSYIVVDNCYGEFVETQEPTSVGADVAMGSLIKNAGGGLAQTGGYIVGTKKAILQISGRYSCPSLQKDIGSYEGGYRSFYQGIFMAPHTVAQALKTAYLIGKVLEEKGCKVLPKSDQKTFDIVKCISFGTEKALIEFVQKIQYYSPVDSFATPEPWDMTGYNCKIIMAAGTFVEGASIELSCDSPIRKPYTAYLQGGLCYEQGKIVANAILESNDL